MALTKVTGQVIKNTTDVTVGVLTVTNTLAVGGTVSIGGTLTYEDVTNVDAVGLITARNGIVVGSGITLSKDGDGFFTGVITATSYSGIDLSDVTGATGDFSIADKIVHTGDTNTAIRFPAADTFTVETGGSERVRIDSSGRFGVGTNNPNNPVTIHGSGNHLYMKDTATNNIFQIRHASNVAEFNSYDSDDSARRPFVFNQYTSEAMRIDSSGRLLLGTTTEGQENADDLTVAGSSNSGITIRSGTSNFGQLFFSDGTSGDDEYRGIVGYSHADNFMKFHTDAVERLRIDSSGLMGLGTDNPSSFNSYARNLVVAKSSGDAGITISAEDVSSEYGSLHFSGGTTVRSYIDVQNGSSGRMFLMNKMSGYMAFGTNNAERLRITSGGDVSIGGMAPDSNVALHIERTSGEANFLLEGDQSTVGGYLMLKNKNNTANSSMSIQFLDASGQGVSEINGVAMSDANNQGYLSLKTRPNGGSMTERFRVSDIGVLEMTQQSNVRTFDFSFSGGIGGSTTTQNIATLTNVSGNTSAVAHVYYVSTYGIANDYIYSGIWVCGTRRKNSNSGWNAQSTQTANGGNGNAGPVVVGWSGGVLSFTCTAFMGYTIHVSLTVYNATTTINAL